MPKQFQGVLANKGSGQSIKLFCNRRCKSELKNLISIKYKKIVLVNVKETLLPHQSIACTIYGL